MKAILLSREGESLVREVKELGIVPIVEDLEIGIEDVKKEIDRGFRPERNIYYSVSAVNIAFKSLRDYKRVISRGAVAINRLVEERLKKEGIEDVEIIEERKILQFISELERPYAIWCSDKIALEVEDKVNRDKAKVFPIYTRVINEESFRNVFDALIRGARYIVFTSLEEVEAWNRIEESLETENLWAIAIGKRVASAIQSTTRLGRVLLYEGELKDLPTFLTLFGVK